MSETTTIGNPPSIRMASKHNVEANSEEILQSYLNLLPSQHLDPLWKSMSKLVPPRPSPRSVPHLWKFRDAKPFLMKAGELVGAEEAERRVLMLTNPAMEAPHTTDTIYGGLQLVLPSETAPAHRHIAFALRFIIEGSGGFTAVEGQKMPLHRGDVILTPSWCWHDHGNEGNEPVIWLDGLDLPLFKHVPVNFAENYQEPRYPSTPSTASPWRFPWTHVESALRSSTGAHRVYKYHGVDSKFLSSTLTAQAEMLKPGAESKPSQRVCSFIYHVYRGRGKTVVRTAQSEAEFLWEEKDTFAVPAWATVVHTNLGETDAFLFAVTDEPLIENLNLQAPQVLAGITYSVGAAWESNIVIFKICDYLGCATI